MTTPILSVSNLSTSFRVEGAWKQVVRNVSFDIAPKETVAVVGESGSGKSVTALSIMRLTPQGSSKIEGSIKLAGQELLTLPEPQMRRIRGNDVAMIFQEPMTSLNPVLTIGFQIAEALILHRGMSRSEAEAETVRLLEKVRIPAAKSRFHEYPHRFSGGMRQRVMIAMALACKPKLLIADEPTTALDVTIQAQILAAHQAAAAGGGHVRALHHPRHGRGRRDRRPHGRDVQRPGGRDRRDRGHLRPRQAPLHPLAALGRAEARLDGRSVAADALPGRRPRHGRVRHARPRRPIRSRAPSGRCSRSRASRPASISAPAC
jgi:ABC-type dipeptide/oligopeptide/nickel transport system ATPase subunit